MSLFHALHRIRPASQSAKKAMPSRMRNARCNVETRESGELAVRSLGVALAIASTAFAAYMISDTERRPQFAGLEHLTIFSKPSHPGAHRAPAQAAGDPRKQIDYTTVGSISERRQSRAVSGFTLLGVRFESAVIQTPTTILRVSQGDLVEGLGRVTAIERRGEKWVVVTPGGLIVGN